MSARNGGNRRVAAPLGGSILTTSAPMPASSRPQYSPFSSAISSTRRPRALHSCSSEEPVLFVPTNLRLGEAEQPRVDFDVVLADRRRAAPEAAAGRRGRAAHEKRQPLGVPFAGLAVR